MPRPPNVLGDIRIALNPPNDRLAKNLPVNTPPIAPKINPTINKPTARKIAPCLLIQPPFHF
jgi:hypothetical protein